MSIRVNVDTFVRAETDRMFADIQRSAGGPGRLAHHRAPTPIDQQTVIRMNRDTLYSFGVVDLARPVTLTLPDAGGRYLSAMIVSNDHHIPVILHDAGDHVLDEATVGTRYALVALRILVDPGSEDDVAAVGALQDAVALSGGGGEPFVYPDYDAASLDATREALLTLASGLSDYTGAFGRQGEVDPIHHLIGTASGWGGLPTSEAVYVSLAPDDAAADQQIVLADVPVDAFWSISVYNGAGFFEPNPYDRYTVNSVTATADDAGAVAVRMVHGEPVGPNDIPVPDAWGIVLRLYRPRDEIRDGTWQAPPLEPIA
ncbi:DUF1254 domain-containing protein [Demequina rhizosphaerae]|uniref:DUF1254 domain-containing protein n=1 Tax=Demequina rhizosphaerae TaxID=1638985 RepID=UPI00078036AD|nr:DUF1254 domain-containing protein [Demequina rhizosphaerae]